MLTGDRNATIPSRSENSSSRSEPVIGNIQNSPRHRVELDLDLIAVGRVSLNLVDSPFHIQIMDIGVAHCHHAIDGVSGGHVGGRSIAVNFAEHDVGRFVGRCHLFWRHLVFHCGIVGLRYGSSCQKERAGGRAQKYLGHRCDPFFGWSLPKTRALSLGSRIAPSADTAYGARTPGHAGCSWCTRHFVERVSCAFSPIRSSIRRRQRTPDRSAIRNSITQFLTLRPPPKGTLLGEWPLESLGRFPTVQRQIDYGGW